MIPEAVLSGAHQIVLLNTFHQVAATSPLCLRLASLSISICLRNSIISESKLIASANDLALSIDHVQV
jgi:hypothetical protein